MAKSLIVEGLKSAVRHARQVTPAAPLRTVFVNQKLDVRALRLRSGDTQEAFAEKFGFSVSAVRNWEQGRRQPSGAQRNLLKLIEAEPGIVERVLKSA